MRRLPITISAKSPAPISPPSKGKSAVVRSKLDLSVEAARDAVDLKALHFTTGKTTLQASGSLAHFAQPQWKGTADWHR